MTVTLWHFTVPRAHGAVLHACVPAIVKAEAERRLRADDEDWSSPDVYCHGGYVVDGQRFRCVPADRLVCWRT